MDAGTLAHELDRLASTARILYVGAHPDDENTRLLAYLANHLHATVAYLSLTRGSGGQNLIGTEQGELLGVLRTQELLAARRVDAAHQRFTRARDFGYSKSAAETLSIWNHDEVLADVVRAIRHFRPDVIVTRFDENPPNHGHHTASAILTREAFVAAGDPNRFPEQLEGDIQPWQATRLLHNLSTWRPVTIPDNAIAIDVGPYDPRLGLSYGELAAVSRSQHKSQGFGRAGERGVLLEHLVPLAGEPPNGDLLSGIESTWARYGDKARPVVAALVGARASLERDRPEAAVPALLAVRAALDHLPNTSRIRDARTDLDRLIASCIGLYARANASVAATPPGGSVDVELEVLARRPSSAILTTIEFPGLPTERVDTPLAPESTLRRQASVTVPADAPVSAPFWLAQAPTPGLYVLTDPDTSDRPDSSPPLAVRVSIGFESQEIALDVPVVHAWTDRVHGERVRPFLVAPPMTVTPIRDSVLSVSGAPARLDLRVRTLVPDADAVVRIDAPEGWRVDPEEAPIHLEQRGDERVLTFTVRAQDGVSAGTLQPVVRINGNDWSWREDVIDYPHVPLQQVFRPAHVHTATVDLAVGTGLVGYVDGSGDTIADDLMHVGYRVEHVDDATLLSGDLSRYAAILVGIRAYNTRDALRRAQERLVRYAEDGGIVVVQYNTSSEWDPLTVPVGPYPLTIGRGRVTDETAEMTPTDVDATLLQRPNRLGESDFGGWVQERGLYFAADWDERWQPLFSLRDPDEESQLGSTLVATPGTGRWIYTGLSFFRQLPAGVPGAYRLLANLLAPPDHED